MVLRITASGKNIPRLEDLRLPPDLVWKLRDSILHEKGLILCAGTTGSGKTTTVCAALHDIRDEPIKMISIEDPVEWDLPGVTQSNINPASGWTFANALKAYLRQDPDLIMVGEIRDRETAEVACRAALTGHCVIATIHARSIEDVKGRLKDWGMPDGILNDTISLVVHQKLDTHSNGTVRPQFTWHCRQPLEPASPARQP